VSELGAIPMQEPPNWLAPNPNTLDADLMAKVEDLARRRGVSFEEVLNELIRQGLAARSSRAAPPPYRVEPHRGGFRPGVDPDKLDQLVDELELEGFVAARRP
jgi:hypothetical protein